MQQHRIVRANLRLQKGAVLIIALVVLMVMTFIALTAMKSSLLESMMSANTQFEIESLANAEVTTVAAEHDIAGIIDDGAALAFETTGDHYFHSGDTYVYKDVSEGQYAIEYAGPRQIAGESSQLGPATAGSTVHAFVVHAHNTSATSASRDVQTLFLTSAAP